MNTSEVLYRAADLIEERGWATGPLAWQSDRNGLCLEGAIFAALGGHYTTGDEEHPSLIVNVCPAGQAVRDYLQLGEFEQWTDDDGAQNTYNDLWVWNDAYKERTAHEVIATLRAAAVIEAAKEEALAEVSA